MGRLLIWAPGLQSCMRVQPTRVHPGVHACTHTHTQRKQKAKREGVTLSKENSRSVIFVLIAFWGDD